MKVNKRRVRAIVRKELREYRRNRSLVVGTMSVLPLIFLIQPLIQVFALPASASSTLEHEHPLLYMLAIPAIVPVLVAAYSVVGERQQGTLEPVLTTPIRREELLLGKALATLMPSVAIASWPSRRRRPGIAAQSEIADHFGRIESYRRAACEA